MTKAEPKYGTAKTLPVDPQAVGKMDIFKDHMVHCTPGMPATGTALYASCILCLTSCVPGVVELSLDSSTVAPGLHLPKHLPNSS